MMMMMIIIIIILIIIIISLSRFSLDEKQPSQNAVYNNNINNNNIAVQLFT